MAQHSRDLGLEVNGSWLMHHARFFVWFFFFFPFYSQIFYTFLCPVVFPFCSLVPTKVFLAVQEIFCDLGVWRTGAIGIIIIIIFPFPFRIPSIETVPDP